MRGRKGRRGGKGTDPVCISKISLGQPMSLFKSCSACHNAAFALSTCVVCLSVSEQAMGHLVTDHVMFNNDPHQPQVNSVAYICT